MADQQIAATVTQIYGEEIRGARDVGAAVAGHGGSSLSVVLAGGPYRWIRKALSTLRHHTRPHRRRIDVAGRRVENGEAFSTHHFQATSLRSPSGGKSGRRPDPDVGWASLWYFLLSR